MFKLKTFILLHLLVAVITVIIFGACSSSPGNSESSDNSPAGVQVPAGYTVERVAGPDLVDYPMFGMVDETGRLFLFESTGNVYEESQDAIENPQFRINLLEDLNGDGVYDQSTIFADKVGFPQGGVFYKGSLYATSAPDLLKFTDTDGDGVADEREVLLSGWVLNVNANSLIGPFMAPDGWLYMTSAIEGFDITTKEGEQLKGETSRIWRVQPDGSQLEWISAGGMNNPVGLTFTEASEPLGTQTYFTDPKAGQRDALMYWTEGGVYPKPNSNITRDQLPLTGELMPVVAKYSRVAPSGIDRYRNTVLGDDFYDNLFSAQFNTHRVLRHKLVREGASFRTEDEVFFWSENEDFHPTDVLEDGDGSLLVVETGGWFIKGCPLSQVSKPELEGDIYRIRLEGAARVEDPYGNAIPWASLDPSTAAKYLEDARPFVADRAAQWLVDQEAEAVGALSDMLRQSSSVNARTKAVFALYRIGNTEALAALRMGLDDPDLQVRIAAARAVGLTKDAGAVEKLMKMARTDEPAGRRQAATALGQIGDERAVPTLLAAAEGTEDRFIEHAIIYALISVNQPELVKKGLSHASPEVKKAALIALDQMPDSPVQAGQLTPFLKSEHPALQRTALWVASHHPEWANEMTTYLQSRLNNAQLKEDEADLLGKMLVSFCGDAGMQQFMVRQMKGAPQERKLFILDAMAACSEDALPESWVNQLGQELTSSADPTVKARVLKLVRLRGVTSLDDQLRQVADDEQNPAVLRIGAMGALLETQPKLTDSHFAYLYDQLQSENEAPVRQQVATVLGQGELSEEQLLKLATDFLPQADAFILPRLMPVFQGANQSEIGEALASALMNSPSLDNFTEENVRTTFAAYPAALNPTVDQLITKLNDAHAERLERLQALESHITEGDIERGRALYFGKAICWTCHTIGPEGGNLGPDLTSIQRDRSVHDLLEAIVYPSVSFVREFETYQIRTETNTYTGIIQEQTPEAILLGTSPQTSVRIPTEEIVSTEILDISMMPQGLEQLLTEQEMADLMAFILGQDQDPDTDEALLR